MQSQNKIIVISFFLVFITLFFCSVSYSGVKDTENKDVVGSKILEGDAYQSYLDFFEEIYDTVDKNYYQDVDRGNFDRFIKKFNDRIYSQLKKTGKSDDFVRWRSAALLIDYLKTQEDIFSAFYPPKPAKEYKQTALGKRVDLGIKGELIDVGYQVTHVEPRSDAYLKGLRKNDLILKIGRKNVLKLKIDKINELLSPLEDTITKITFLSGVTREKNKILVETKEYFKQAVFPMQVNVPGIFGLTIERFNRKTGEDVFRLLNYFRSIGEIKGLIIDLRGNPGGPPLAAREISSFFLSPGEEFAYFKKKNQPKASLDVPEMPKKFRYEGPMVIFVDEKSGSSSELFSGVMQKRGRAILMGQNSAGQVMLKSMFHFSDESMVLLITGRGHYPDGSVFSFSGLNPDRRVLKEEEDNLIKYAAMYLLYMNKKNETWN